jgi:hypothetical protein
MMLGDPYAISPYIAHSIGLTDRTAALSLSQDPWMPPRRSVPYFTTIDVFNTAAIRSPPKESLSIAQQLTKNRATGICQT